MDTRERIQRYYDQASEDDRLGAGDGLLEFHRSKEIISDYLPKKRLRILDVGGGTGPYSFWLSRAGHEVHLLDASNKHIYIATERNAAEKYPLASIKLGEARDLPFIDEYFDVVLLMGPLYHLMEPTDRQIALREATRVLRQNGMLFAAYISRYASLLDGYRA